MIHIKKLNKKGLEDYIHSDEYKKASHIAISKHRALSQISNPRAKDNDILLILAYEGVEMVGYLGILPDDIYQASGKYIHLGWMSCLWINPEQRGKKIAQQLVQECMTSWNSQIILTEYTAAAGMLYKKSKLFEEVKISSGRRWYIQSNLSKLLPPKSKIWLAISPLLSLIDFIVNSFMNGLKIFKTPKVLPVGISEIDLTRKENHSLVEKNINKHLFRKAAADIEWILKYPWILIGDPNTAEAKRYHFSSFSEEFIFKAWGLKNEQEETCAFMIFSIRNGHLRIPYFYHHHKDKEVKDMIKYIIVRYNIKMFTTYNMELINILQMHSIGYYISKSMKRSYMASSKIADYFSDSELLIQDGDGDCGFT